MWVVRGHSKVISNPTTLIEITRLSCTLFSSYSELFVESGRFNLPIPAFRAPVIWITPNFAKTWHQKTKISELSCSVVCVILCLAVYARYQRVTDGQTKHNHASTASHGENRTINVAKLIPKV